MKKIRKLFFLAITHIFCVLNFSLFANEITHYTAIQGLSGTDITAICENENYLWIATNDGLCRFDGKVFKVYKKERGTANSISENNIETLKFDSEGLLWIGFKTGGLDVYDPRKGSFTHISKLTDKCPQRVTSIFEDSNKEIWLSSWEEGLFELIPTHKQKTKYHTRIHLNNAIVSGVIELPKNKLWAGTYSGLYYYNKLEKKWSIADDKPVVSQLLTANDKKSFLCSTWNEGILKVDDIQANRKFNISHLSDNEDEIYRMCYESDNQLFVGTWGNGLKIFNNVDGTLNSFDAQFKPLVIMSIMKDSYNNIWVGTYGNGLFRITTSNRGIQSYTPINQSGYAAVFALKSINSNQLIIGSEGEGLYHYDIAKSLLIKKDKGLYANGQHNFVLTIYKDNNLIIIGHDDFGVYLAPNQENPNKINYKKILADRRFAKITFIFKSNDNKLWFGTKQNGLISAVYNPSKKTLENFAFYDVGTGQITGIAQYDNNRLWIASHNGLFLFDSETKKNENKQKPVLSEMIYSMTTDTRNQCLWLGTSVGLRKLNYHNNNEIEIPFLGLLPQGAITDLILDDFNNLWFSIGSRVFCLFNKNKKLKEINMGEYGNQLFLSSTSSSINGKNCVVFGGEKSMVAIDPAMVLNQQDESKIVFTELQIDHSKVDVGEKIYGSVVLEKQTEYIDKIEFSYKCKWVSLSFTQVGGNNFKNHYQYKIDGFSQNWQFLDTDKPIIFSQLQPGDYKLVIKRIDANEKDNPLWYLDIIVTPPWYKTKLFYFSLIVLFILLVFLVINIIKKRFEQSEKLRITEMEKKKKEEILLEKESFFAGLSHDLLTPFSLIIAPAGDLMKAEDLSTENKEKINIINKNATYLSDIFKTILDFKRIETIDITLEERTIDVISFIKIIIESFSYLAKSKKINFLFTTEVNPLIVKIDIIKFERVLFNLLSNAFKFTNQGGEIALHLSCNDNNLILELQDNGIGIEEDKLQMIFDKFYQHNASGKTQGFGLGLYIVKKFITVMNGTIRISSEPNKGTSISILLPIQKDNTEPNLKDISTITDDVNSESEVSILLVEDNDEMRSYLKKQLSVHFQVATATNGLEALHFIQSYLPEIVITDVMMPEMDGLTLCSEIKKSQLYSDIFVVLLSARSSSEDELLGYKSGADFYISKPFDSERFVKQILNIHATRIQRRKQILTTFFNSNQDTTHSTPKDDFLHKAMQIIDKNIADEDFKIDDFASQMNMSKTVLHRKFKLLIGESPNMFVRRVRLNRASKLLLSSVLTVAEIAYLTGFHQSHYFIKCFKEEYGVTPKYYRETKEQKN
ncbi:MAG: hypothetical protein H6Q18_9 [Bacteroidetes bacterium]|nr:hypothetical protein [Bacteroidota bacterium]